MASSSNVPTTAMSTPWVSPVEPLKEGEVAAIVKHEPIEVMSSLKAYSLRNGTPDEVEPYLLTSAIPSVYHWIPMNGLAPKDALRCVDGFIKCYLYALTSSENPTAADPLVRKQAIILGTCRAVMTTNYELLNGDINAQELAAPLMSVEFGRDGRPGYTALVANNSVKAALLTDDLGLDATEVEIVKVLARSAQAIIPVQGLNLITDGHHYLSEKSKQSYKAFLAVEKQVWVPRAFKDWITGIEDVVRDLIWHKAGHPVAVYLKEAAATSPQVKANLDAAKMGSAAARLPALDSDLRAADTYLKLAEAVGAIWSTMNGEVDAEVLRYRAEMVKGIPRGVTDLARELDMGEGTIVKTRAAAVAVLKATVAKNADKAALLYGFYCAMLESNASEGGAAVPDTLKMAFSLKKLKSNNIASYLIGTENFRDYRAMKAAARKSADRKMPSIGFDA